MGYWEASQTVIQHIIILKNNIRMNLREKINLITATYLLDCNFSLPNGVKTIGHMRRDGEDHFCVASTLDKNIAW